MRSLGFKLIVAFLVVSVTSAILMAVFASFRTSNEFGDFIFNQNREGIVAQLSNYYLESGTWEGVEVTLPHLNERPPYGPFPRQEPGNPFTLVNEAGNVVIAGRGFKHGQHVGKEGLPSSIPIDVDGVEVGTIFLARGEYSASRAGEVFLEGMNRIFALTIVGALVVAIVLGILLTRALTRPLAELTAATRAVAAGDLEQEVPVRSKDELGELAQSFNAMNRELARSRDMRRQMTADIAHELRTPLSVIIGHTEAVHDGVLQPTLEIIDLIRDEANRLERLVEDLRTLSRSESGELTLARETISTVVLIKKTIKAYGPRAKKLAIQILFDEATESPIIEVDPDRMTQVLGNLLDNALRYSPEGGEVEFSIETVDDQVEIRLRDSGPGIEVEKLDQIFERFYRVDESRQRHEGGSGLGLAITKSIVERHGGKIWAESRVGEGTIIILSLPRAMG